MKITVAIACYNLEDRIAECLESVISQDFQNIEILVVDDHSIDHSVEVVNKVIKDHPEREFRLIINNRNQGLCRVRNISIDEARGDTIFFMDGDDTIEPGTLSLFHKRMVETGVEVVRGSFKKTDGDGNALIIKQFPDDTIKGDFAFATYIERHIKGFFWLPIWNNLYRLDFLRSHNIHCATNYIKHEGSYFTFQICLNAQSISYIHDVTYNWHDSQSSITRQIDFNKEFLKIFALVIESVVKAKNKFELQHNYKPLPYGASFLLNYIIFTQGLLKRGIMSPSIKSSEKKQFLRWLKMYYRKNNMNLSNIVGPFNRISYLILISPFPYALFRYYFKHLKTVSKIVNRLVK